MLFEQQPACRGRHAPPSLRGQDEELGNEVAGSVAGYRTPVHRKREAGEFVADDDQVSVAPGDRLTILPPVGIEEWVRNNPSCPIANGTCVVIS